MQRGGGNDMAINFNEIHRAMWEHKYSMSKVAKELDISTSSLSRKLSGKTEFTVSEATKICSVLELNPNHIFFTSFVPNTQQNMA